MGFLDLINRIPTLNELTGSFGEWLAKTYSKTLPGALVLHDVLIDGDEGFTSQLDLVIVGNKGIYVVEVKSFTEAKIYGDTKSYNWKYYSHGRKYEIYSPLKQNQKHVKYLKRFLKGFGDLPVFSIITLICDDFKIRGDFDGKTVVCSSLPAMKRGIYKLSKNQPEVIDDIKKQEIFEYIKNNQHQGKEKRIEHKKQVIEYKRKTAEMEEKGICPRCKGELVLRKGKNGEFYGCKNFPKCRYTRPR